MDKGRVRDLADALLSRITEDETGIWELTGEARNHLRDIPEGERFEVAKAALDLLIAMDFVRARRGLPFAEGVRLDEGATRALIKNAAEWQSPDDGVRVTLMLDATTAGLAFYFSGRHLSGSAASDS